MSTTAEGRSPAQMLCTSSGTPHAGTVARGADVVSLQRGARRDRRGRAADEPDQETPRRAAHGRASIAIDDVLPPWQPRMIELRRTAAVVPEGGKALDER